MVVECRDARHRQAHRCTTARAAAYSAARCSGEVDVGGGRLRARLAHQLAQHQEVDAGGGKLGPISVTQAMWTHARRAPEVSR